MKLHPHSGFARVLAIVTLLAFAGCSPAPEVSELDATRYRGYIPIEPIPTKRVCFYSESEDSCLDTAWRALSPSEILALLPLQTAEVSVRQITQDGSIKYLGSAAGVQKGSFEVVMDYMKYRVESIRDQESVYVGSRRIGIGLRMTANVRTLKSNLNISGLGALSAGATSSSLTGSLSVNVIGIDSRDVTNLIPMTSQLNQTSIQSALQALAAVKSKMWDTSETTLTPHVVAVLQRKDSSLDVLENPGAYATYTESKSGECIESWWRPDHMVDEQRTDSLNAWLVEHKPDGAPETIAELINGLRYEPLRQAVIEGFDIPCVHEGP